MHLLEVLMSMTNSPTVCAKNRKKGHSDYLEENKKTFRFRLITYTAMEHPF